jgi:hypothetical protein
MNKKRPISVNILAILAGIAVVFAAIRCLQFLGLIPFFMGPISFRTVSLIGALMYALLVWIYIWLVRALLNVDKEAWMFLLIISIFYLILDSVMLIGGGVWQDVEVSFVIKSIILIYSILPGVKAAFDVETTAA